MKYIYIKFNPSGFNDILGNIYRCYIYTSRFNRILLIDFENTIYDCNLNLILSFKQNNIICDSQQIKIIKEEHKNNFYHIKELPHQLYKIQKDYKENFLTVGACGWCNSKKTNKTGNEDSNNYEFLVYSFFFKSIIFSKFIRKYCKEKSKLLPRKYSVIQIRNTDRKSDYLKLLHSNLNKCNKNIYIATDDSKCFNHLKNIFINNNFINFSHFPEENGPLHYSNIPGTIKLRDIFFDLFVIYKSNTFFTNSKGRFSGLCKFVYNNKNLIKY